MKILFIPAVLLHSFFHPHPYPCRPRGEQQGGGGGASNVGLAPGEIFCPFPCSVPLPLSPSPASLQTRRGAARRRKYCWEVRRASSTESASLTSASTPAPQSTFTCVSPTLLQWCSAVHPASGRLLAAIRRCQMQRSVVQCSAVLCSKAQGRAGQCSTSHSIAEQCSAMQSRAVHCSAVQSSTAQGSAVQHITFYRIASHCSAVLLPLSQGQRFLGLGVAEPQKRVAVTSTAE